MLINKHYFCMNQSMWRLTLQSAGLSLFLAAPFLHYFLIRFPWRMKRHVGLHDEAARHGHAPPLEPISPSANLIMPFFFVLLSQIFAVCVLCGGPEQQIMTSDDEIMSSTFSHEAWANARIIFENHLRKEKKKTFTRGRSFQLAAVIYLFS